MEESILRLLDNIPFFSKFSSREKEYVSKLANHVLRFRQSDTIIKEGDFDQVFYILLKGAVRITKTAPPRGEAVLTRLKAGAVFGEIAWISKRARTTSVIAEAEDTIALRIDMENIGKIDSDVQNKIKDQLIAILANRLETINNSLAQTRKTL